MNSPLTSRREALAGAVGIAAASVLAANKTASAASGVGGITAIPELAPQWKKLDLANLSTVCTIASMATEERPRRRQQDGEVLLCRRISRTRGITLHRCCVAV